MWTLVLDSSNILLSVGLAKDNYLVDEISYEAWQRQSELMVDEIDKLLKRNNVNPKDIDKVVAAKGPGSYTGVRIALSIAKTYAFALNIPLYVISSLHAMTDINKPTICLINARSNRSYIGVYDKDKVLLSDTIMSNDDVLEYVKKHNDYAISGDTAYLNIDGMNIDTLKTMLFLVAKNQEPDDPVEVKPVYLKDVI